MIKFNAIFDKSPKGAATVNEIIEMSFEISIDMMPKSLSIILRGMDGESYTYPFKIINYIDRKIHFSLSFMVEKSGIYYYRFELTNDCGSIVFIGADEALNAVFGDWLPEFQLTVCDKLPSYPSTNGGIIYHIFVDRFYKSEKTDVTFNKRGKNKTWNEELDIQDEEGNYQANDFYGGNLYGIADKINYFKELSVTHLYLSPIFEAGSNHRYDTGDYMKIDDLLGGEAGFDYLLEKAKEVNIGIILDGVFNHSGADSIYFNKFGYYESVGAYQSRKSPYHDWYSFDKFPDTYNCWWGMTCVPTFNKQNKDFIEYLIGKGGVLERWLDKGIAGWRLDVVDEFSIEFTDLLTNKIKEYAKDALIIGEVWEDASTKVSYSQLRPYYTKGQLNGVMNYVYKEAIIDYIVDNNHKKFINTIASLINNYPTYALQNCMTLLGSHDTVRILNRLSGIDTRLTSKKDRLKMNLVGNRYNKALNRVKMAALLQYTILGTPTIYYGDEIGMQGYEDPINRRTFTWDKINESLLSFYKKLGKIRTDYKDVFLGEMYPIQHESLLLFTRESKKEKLIVIVNNTQDDIYYMINGKSLLYDIQYCGNTHVFAKTYDIVLVSC